MNKYKLTLTFLFCLAILLTFPLNFAESSDLNSTIEDNYNFTENTLNAQEIENENDIYFNASSDYDGDGSKDTPFKYLNNTRMKDNSNIYLSNGEYNLDNTKNVNTLNIIGQDSSKTIIKYNGIGFEVNGKLTLKNVTLLGVTISNTGNINAQNTFFINGQGTKVDSDNNSFGGAIITQKSYPRATITLSNCSLINNSAIYGGAIYMASGNLEIKNSEFINNHAYNYGGAISCEDIMKCTISNSKFINDYSIDDSGGAIYIKSTPFKANDLHLINCSSKFGGAITSLSSNINLKNINAHNNTAQWRGGAIFTMYGDILLEQSTFQNNSANEGGALVIDDCDSIIIRNNNFIQNNALTSGGAISSIFNDLSLRSLTSTNRFINNTAPVNNDFSAINKLNLNIGSNNYTIYVANYTEINEIPYYYNSAALGYISSVKDQYSGGNCWAFAAISTLESCIKKITGEEIDLSEENMKNLLAKYSDYGRKTDTNHGGLFETAFGYLTSWLGPVYESDDHYDDKSVLSPILNSVLHIQNIIFLKRDSYTDNDEIKKAIMKYGAVTTSMLYDSDYYYNNSFYIPPAYCDYADHEVTIVGWDDNYSKYNFKYTPRGDGAWICKNSWGDEWGDNGYFYASYYDGLLAEPKVDGIAYTFEFNDTIRFDKNYQYDIGGMTFYLYDSTPKIWYKNKFVSTDNELLKGVSTYFKKLTNWTLYVYVNNELRTVQSGTNNGGYYTINLNEAIQLYKGDTFEVVFNTVCKGNSAVPICEKGSFNKPTFTPEVSYISTDGQSWADLYDYYAVFDDEYYYSQVACIKAFTVLNNITTTTYLNVTYDKYNPVNITISVIDEYGKNVNGNVNLTINGKTYIVKLNKGKLSLTYNLDKGLNNISVKFDGDGYISSSNSTSINILKKIISLNSTIQIHSNTIRVNISSNETLNSTIIIDLKNEIYTIDLTNGFASFNKENLDNGEYPIKIKMKDNVYECEDIIDSFTINVNKTKLNSSDLVTIENKLDNYSIYLLDKFNNPLSNKTIIFKVNNQEYVKNTDNSGLAQIAINLTNGKYEISAKFNGDENYAAITAVKQITVKIKVEIDYEIKRNQENVTITFYLSKSINETINASLNGMEQKIIIKNGKGILNLTSLENGNYTLIPTMNDETYNYTKIKINFIVDVKNTQILSDNISAYFNSKEDYKITLIDENGIPLKNELISCFINNNPYYSSYTNENGELSIPINLSIGTYNVSFEFRGSENYTPSQNYSIIIIKTSIILPHNQYSLNSAYTVELYDENGKINYPYVEININNKIYRLTQDKNHDFSLNILLDLGTYNIKVANPSTEETKIQTITVVPRLTNNKNIKNYYGSKNTYTVRAFSDDGSPVGSGEIVKFKINGKTYEKVTDKKGYASITLTLTKDGSISAEYKGFKVVNKIIVKPTLITKDKRVKKSKRIVFKAKLLNSNGKPLKNKKIVFKIKNKKYVAKTNKKGISKIYIKGLKIGKYKITSQYKKIKVTNKITVK